MQLLANVQAAYLQRGRLLPILRGASGMLPAGRFLPSSRVVSRNRRHDLSQIGLGDLSRQHDMAVADDREFVTEIENLREPVRHVDDSNSRFRYLSKDSEEALDLAFGQCCGRFVQDQNRARQA